MLFNVIYLNKNIIKKINHNYFFIELLTSINDVYIIIDKFDAYGQEIKSTSPARPYQRDAYNDFIGTINRSDTETKKNIRLSKGSKNNFKFRNLTFTKP